MAEELRRICAGSTSGTFRLSPSVGIGGFKTRSILCSVAHAWKGGGIKGAGAG